MTDQNIPTVPPVEQTPITPGKTTSEYQMAANAQRVATVVTLLGAVGTVLGPLVEQASASNPGGKLAVWGGLALGAVGLISKALISLGYTGSRTAVKSSPYTK